MQLDELLRLLRTRWYVVVVVTGIFVVLAWVIVPGRLPTEGRERFQATTTLVMTSGTAPPAKVAGSQLSTYALIGSQGRPLTAVAEQVGVSPSELLAQVELTPSVPTNSLTIVATDRTAPGAQRIVDLFGTELLRALEAQATNERDTTKAALVKQLDDLMAEAAKFAGRPNPDPATRAEIENANRRVNAQRVKIAELEGSTLAPPLRSLGPPSVKALKDVNEADRFLAFPVRSLLALLLGLGGSVGVLLLADRFDVRLHTRAAAEVAFGFPVLAEVPVLPRELRRGVAVADAPETAFAEAHRILRTSVEVARLASGGATGQHVRPRLVLITSADPNEGKTTTAVNLAASFAEAGRTTLLVGADMRKNDLLQVVSPPLAAQILPIGALGQEAGRPVVVRVGHTRLANLRCVTLEPPIARPPIVMPRLAAWLLNQRSEVGTIIVDTPPLLVCNDASELIPMADAVLIVCRVGWTTVEAAERCSELLARLGAKVIGVVMVGASLRAPVRKVYGYSDGSPRGPEDAAPDPPAGPLLDGPQPVGDTAGLMGNPPRRPAGLHRRRRGRWARPAARPQPRADPTASGDLVGGESTPAPGHPR